MNMRQALVQAGVEEKIRCPYCNELAVKVTGEQVYPRRKDLHWLFFYVCTPCDARVGCHKDTGVPLGVLANAELRNWRMQAHKVFDSIWKGSAMMKRRDAYHWLRTSMGMSSAECHIGNMDIISCKQVIKLCKERL